MLRLNEPIIMTAATTVAMQKLENVDNASTQSIIGKRRTALILHLEPSSSKLFNLYSALAYTSASSCSLT